MIDKLVVIGVGLIGGSVSLSLKKAGYVKKVVGVGRSQSNLERAMEAGVIDEISDIHYPVEGASVVLIATPVLQNYNILGKLSWAVDQGVIITDAGSTKREFAKAAQTLYPNKLSRIIAGHPIAGAEQVGFEAANAHLYKNKPVVITPLPENDKDALSAVENLWAVCGAKVIQMPVEHHDWIFSAVSHLPHVLAFALVEMISRKSRVEDNLFEYTGGGFRDFTRIAGSSPEMWRDICMANKDLILDDIDAYQIVLSELKKNIERSDKEGVLNFFEDAREARQKNLKKIND